MRRLGWFLYRKMPSQSLFRRHSSAPSPRGKVFGCPKRRMNCQPRVYALGRLIIAPTSTVENGEPTQLPDFRQKLRWLFIKCQRFRRTTCSTIESVETVCLPHATGGPKSRKLHQCEFVGLTHVSPPNPRIKARFQRAALEPFGVSFFHIFLHAKKDMATGGRSEKRMPVKTRKKRYRPRRAQD